jgi:hypothetical protein
MARVPESAGTNAGMAAWKGRSANSIRELSTRGRDESAAVEQALSPGVLSMTVLSMTVLSMTCIQGMEVPHGA